MFWKRESEKETLNSKTKKEILISEKFEIKMKNKKYFFFT